MKSRIYDKKGKLYPIRLLTILAALFLVPINIFGQAMVVSSYFNAADPRDEWTELLVIQDNLDVRNWTIGDNNSTQDSWQTRITFRNDPFWQNLRAGTIIIIWHRPVNSAGVARPEDLDLSDGFLQFRANNAGYFTGGDFGTTPLWAGNSLNIASGGDLIQLRDASNIHVHALGHRTTPGSSYTAIPNPKLNHTENLSDNEVVMVVPGNNIAQYGTSAPQNGTFWTTRSGVNLTQGLPNTSATYPLNNSVYWRTLRQASWPTPNPSFTVNATNTAVTLNWTPVPDPVIPLDGTIGYMVVRNTVDVFSDPTDGYTYTNGELIGTATVVNASIAWSNTSSFIDNIAVPCADGFYYRVYPFKFAADNINGNNYNSARGRAYNETQYAAIHVTVPSPTDLTSVTSDAATPLCDNNLPAVITLTANGGSGEILEWFAGSGCAGTPIGTGPSFVVTPVPTVSTTYSAHWKTTHCGNSACEDITITVNPANNHSVSIASTPGTTVCAGETVTVTATPVSSSSPSYQWLLNGNPVGLDQNTHTFIPGNGDQISVEMTSVEVCSTNPATSNIITFTVNPLLTPSVTIDQVNPQVCGGTNVNLTAIPVNGGTNPVYTWYVNTVPQATTGNILNYLPANGDQVYVVLTSNEACVTSPTATSPESTVTVTTSYTQTVGITADDDDVCELTSVLFTATPGNNVSGLTYSWYVNGGLQTGATGSTFSYTPADNDQVYAIMADPASCALGSPATSNTILMNVTPLLNVAVTITADATTVCSGPASSVEFTASTTTGGSSPSYEWYVDGALQTGEVTSVFNYANPSDGEVITAVLINNDACSQGSPATSNGIPITVIQSVDVSVSLISDQTSICAGSTVTFTANTSTGGASPQYVFYINGTAQPVQTSPEFSYAPANGDSFYVTLTNNESCAVGSPATSNSITITVSSSLPVSATVAADINPICSGTPATYTATPTNGGGSPVYAWYLGGVVQPGFTGPTFTNNTPTDGEQVYVVLTNNETCATGSPATSNIETLNVTTSVIPSISLIANQTTVCSGSQVIFTAFPTNEGTVPDYTWYVDNVEQILATGPTFSYTPTSDISVYVELVSNANCANPNTAQSLPVDISVTLSYAVSVSAAITGSGQLCQGDNVTVSATSSTGGPSPQYQWYLNSSAVTGETNPDFTFTPDNGDNVYVTLTNNESCATGSPAQSAQIPLSVNTPAIVGVSVTPDQTSVCSGGAVQYIAQPQNEGASPAYRWFVDGVLQTETSDIFNYIPDEGEMVKVELTSNATCITSNPAESVEVTVSVITGPAAAISMTSNSSTVCTGEPVTFNAAPVNEGTAPAYAWFVNGVLQAGTATEFTCVPADGDLVEVVMNSSEQCATSNPATAGETVALSPCGFVMAMPNIFTPDNNLVNDVFKPVMGEIRPSKYLLQVYNRWGEIVFETNDPDHGWDGNIGNEPAPKGIYVYKLEFVVPEYITNSLESPLKGMVMLLR